MRQNVKIANSERSERFDADQLPWIKGPISAAFDDDTQQIVCVFPTGSGKSTMAEGLIPRVVSEDPGPFLYASQTDSDARYWGETRLLPALKSCRSIAEMWPQDRHAVRKLEIIFPHMPLVLCGANISSFQEKSMRWLYGDEVWEWDEGLITEFLARHHNRWNRKVMLVSQAGIEETEFHSEWVKTDMAEFSWRCDCNEQQPYDFQNSMKWDRITREDGSLDELKSSQTCRMVCRSCSKAHADNVTTRRKLASSNIDNGAHGYLSTNPSHWPRYKGFHLDSLAVWWIPWQQEVLKFLEADRLKKAGILDPLRQWMQKRRAKFWNMNFADEPTELSIGNFAKADYTNGESIDGEVMRYATIDVGKDHFWVMITAWRNGGSCAVIHEGYHPSHGGNEQSLVDLLAKYRVPEWKVFLDLGYEKDRVLELCKANGWNGIRGDGKHDELGFRHAGKKGTIHRPYSKILREAVKTGGFVKFVYLASNTVKDALAEMIRAGMFESPADSSVAYQSHMTTEKRTVEIHPKTGREKPLWVRPGGKAQHLWDCAYYAVGIAMLDGVFAKPMLDTDEEE